MRLLAVIVVIAATIALAVIASTVDLAGVQATLLRPSDHSTAALPAETAVSRARERILGDAKARAERLARAVERAGDPPEPRRRPRAERKPRQAQAAPPAQAADPKPGRLARTVRTLGRIVLMLATAALVLAAVAGAAMLVTRTRSRRRREVVRYQLVPFRADEVTPDQVRRLLESWHQQLLERWRTRPLRGQPAIALETRMEPDAQGGFAVRLMIAMPHELVEAVEGSLRACYPNCRLELRDEEPLQPRELVRLKKRMRFIQALRTPREEDPVITDAILTAMGAIHAPAIVQIVLTPTPALFDGFARGRFRARERSAMRGRMFDRADPGLSSELLERELEGGLSVQHRPLFFTEIRVGAPTREACAAIAGVIRGETGGENRLVLRPLYERGRLGLYQERLRRALGNPLPSWRRGVLASSELAGLWRLPSAGLASVAVTRSPVPRVDASPAISRHPAHALLHDEQGPVGILAVDKTDGLGLIGGQKTGKTSVLCQTVRVDAEDPDCALIVLMPKPGDARKALSTIPTWRTVHYLDFEQPAFGINPLLAVGEAAMVADKVVDSFRDVNMEGDIRGSSDRYLRQAAQAAIGASRAGAIEGPPTLWHMYRMLLPSEVEFREHVVRSIYGDPRFTDTATFFGRDLPNDLRDALVNTTSKLDAPRNKILRLMVESLDLVLRHPRQIDLEQIVRNREVLIVDGKMGTFGSDNCRVMMQFILNMLYGVLQRQQQRPEAERVRVAVKVDEAHLILNESFADALATLRSAGLEMVAAWQYGEQIQDPKIRSGMMSLLRQRCMFSMGETADARAMSEITMALYSDVISAEPESRARMQIGPDTIINLPNHHAVCSWISNGARMPGFVAQTIPLADDPAVVAAHLEAQTARGGFVPERLPDPLPDVVIESDTERAVAAAVGVSAAPVAAPVAVGVAGGGVGGAGAGDEGDAADGDDAAPVAASTDAPELHFQLPEADAAPARPDAASLPVPETFTELDLDDVRGLDWERVRDGAPAVAPHEPSQKELEILSALWRWRVLFASQLHRRWWEGASLRAAQHGLQKMTRAGWVRRARFSTEQRGAQQWMYMVTREGFELAQRHAGRRGPYIDPALTWREPQISDPRRLLRTLHVNAWALALEQRAGRAISGWRGPRDAKLNPPRRRVRGEWLDLRPEEVTVGASRRLDGLAPGPFEAVTPGAAVELRLMLPGGPVRIDLLIDAERGHGGAAREDKLRRYDALLTGWARMLDRYQMLGTTPLVVLVAEDEPSALGIVRLADRLVTGRLAKAGEPESEWPHPGRKGLFVVNELDLHLGSLAAYQLPELPPEVRVKVHGRGAAECRERRVELIDPRLLPRSTRS